MFATATKLHRYQKETRYSFLLLLQNQSIPLICGVLIEIWPLGFALQIVWVFFHLQCILLLPLPLPIILLIRIIHIVLL